MKVVIALGSNIGESELILRSAINSIKECVDVLAVSRFYTTAPVGGPEQPDYLNAVLVGDCAELTPIELLHTLQRIEAAAGRTREIHWGPRTLDLDLIIFGDEILASPELTVPHPSAHERRFVLEPWHEIDPTAVIPGRGAVAQLLESLSSEDPVRAGVKFSY